jgi:hypothetical protein
MYKKKSNERMSARVLVPTDLNTDILIDTYTSSNKNSSNTSNTTNNTNTVNYAPDNDTYTLSAPVAPSDVIRMLTCSENSERANT